VLQSVRRAGELLGDIGNLWAHPGVTDERRAELVGEVFERIEVDRSGIRTVLPTDEYRPLFAVVENGRGGGKLARSCVRTVWLSSMAWATCTFRCRDC
jgi:hypothetical protein